MAERKVVVVDGKGGGPMFRAIGTCDIDGNGTTFDLPDGSPFQSAGPFVLLDVVTMPSVAGFKAPFCAHPHSGAIVCSVLIEGKEFRAWDNVRGAEPEPLTPGGVYKLDSAYGCVHDEKPDPISLRGCTKAVFAEGEDNAAEGFCFCQLWINPGGLEALDSKPMSSQVVQPDEISIVNEGALTVRLLAGSYGGATSPLSLPDELQLVLMHGQIEAGGSAELALPPGHEGFMVLVKDSAPATIDGQPVAPRQTAIIGHGDSSLKIAAANKDSPVYFLLGLGVPSTEGFAKLLGFGGALLEATEDAVRAKMEVYASDPQGFGREICSAPAAAGGLPDLSSDLAQYKMVEGFQNNGDDLMPGKEARWTLAVDDPAL
jgi:redox-sensitive bicupin YhaK (pirin superfamily)